MVGRSKVPLSSQTAYTANVAHALLTTQEGKSTAAVFTFTV